MGLILFFMYEDKYVLLILFIMVVLYILEIFVLVVYIYEFVLEIKV